MANENLRKALAGVRASKKTGEYIKRENAYADKEAHTKAFSEKESIVRNGPRIPWGYLAGTNHKKEHPKIYSKEERDEDAQRLGIARGLDRDRQLKFSDTASRYANHLAYKTIKNQNLKKAMKGMK